MPPGRARAPRTRQDCSSYQDKNTLQACFPVRTACTFFCLAELTMMTRKVTATDTRARVTCGSCCNTQRGVERHRQTDEDDVRQTDRQTDGRVRRRRNIDFDKSARKRLKPLVLTIYQTPVTGPAGADSSTVVTGLFCTVHPG